MEKLQLTPHYLIDSIHLNNTWNEIDEKEVKQLGEGIAKCATLSSLNLDLSSNSIGDNGAMHLGEGIA